MGYDVQAAQFLIKPIVWDKLRTAILRDCRKRYGQKNMVLQKGRKLLKLPLEDVLYAEADGKHGSGSFLPEVWKVFRSALHSWRNRPRRNSSYAAITVIWSI